MAKTQRGAVAMNQVVRQVSRPAKKPVRAAAPAKANVAARKVQVTLGDLIAAAFDVAGETKAAAKLVSSRAMSLATGTQIVVVA